MHLIARVVYGDPVKWINEMWSRLQISLTQLTGSSCIMGKRFALQRLSYETIRRTGKHYVHGSILFRLSFNVIDRFSHAASAAGLLSDLGHVRFVPVRWGSTCKRFQEHVDQHRMLGNCQLWGETLVNTHIIISRKKWNLEHWNSTFTEGVQKKST